MENANRFSFLDIFLYMLMAGLIASGWFCLQQLPDFSSVSDYFERATIYRQHQAINLFFFIPVLILSSMRISRFDTIRRLSSRIIKLWNGLPAVCFWGVIPVIFGLVSAWTAYRMLGAAPRILDAFNYLFQAENFALGQTHASLPPAQDLFRFPFILMEHGRWYGSVYPGYPVLLSLGVILHAPWAVNPVIGVFCIILTYRIGSFVWSSNLNRLAVLILSLSPFFRMMCSIHMAHAAATMWLLLSVWGILKWTRSDTGSKWSWPLIAGIGLGQLIITRPQAAAVLMTPFLIYNAIQHFRRRNPWFQCMVFVIPIAIAFAGLGLYNKSLTGDSSINPRYYVDPGRRLGFGEDIGEPLQGGRRGGHSISKGFQNLNTLATLWNSDMFGQGGWNSLGLCSCLLVAALACPRRNPYILMMVSGLLINFILYFFYFTPSANFGPRYLAESAPWTVFICLEGARCISDRVIRWSSHRRSSFSVVFLLVSMFFQLIVYNPVHYRHYGFLPETLDRKTIQVPAECEPAIVLIPAHFYRMNVFTWNSPNLTGNIFIRDGNPGLVEELAIHFPDRCIIRLAGIDQDKSRSEFEIIRRPPGLLKSNKETE